MKKVVYFDMDEVVCDFMGMKLKKLQENPSMPYPQAQIDFWTDLEPINGAIQAYKRLNENFEVWFLTSPSIYNPASYAGKRIWIEKHFGMEGVENLILSYDKSKILGDYPVDDGDWNNQSGFKGEWVLYNSNIKGLREWERVVQYIEKKEGVESCNNSLN